MEKKNWDFTKCNTCARDCYDHKKPITDCTYYKYDNL